MMGEQRPTCRVLCACICVLALGVGSIDGAQYNNSAAVEYAQAWWNGANHDCGSSYDACTPWSYWGSEHCGLSSHGGDGANFVSQCLLAAGHPDLVISPCRGYPCGREEIGGITLSTCLYQNYGWKSTCGAHAALPSSIVPGDVLVFHGSSCTDSDVFTCC
ncbi:hypothetical protein Pelo_10144 [Pelomyxa schiedti]|nr:hypothetical protein Pelo_10144 [Pelomyxa schiedti]